MSSKILPPGTAVDRIVWRSAFSPAPGEPEPPLDASEATPAAPDTSPTPAVPPGIPEEEVARMIETEAARRAAEARQRGFDEGRLSGEQAAWKQLEPLLARMARTVEDLTLAGRQLRRDAEADVVKLAVTIARRILHREIQVDPEALLGIVRAALDRLDARELHRIRLHPDDLPRIRPEIERRSLPTRVEMIADPSLERGALIFETARGTLDASFETQLDEIDRGLADALRRRP